MENYAAITLYEKSEETKTTVHFDTTGRSLLMVNGHHLYI